MRMNDCMYMHLYIIYTFNLQHVTPRPNMRPKKKMVVELMIARYIDK